MEEIKRSQVKKKRILFQVALALLGGALGYVYWYFYGCDHGCTITSNAWYTTLYGVLLGYLLSGSVIDLLFKKIEKK